MKLNMMVVMTMWLPRLACSQAGMKAQAAPNRPPAMMASGSKSANGSTSPSSRQTRPTPRPPI